MGDASKVCVEQPVEERVPEAVAEGEPCHGEIYARRYLRSVHGKGTESQKVSSTKTKIKSERGARSIWLAFTARNLSQRVYIKSTVEDGSEAR